MTNHPSSLRTWAEVDLDAIRHNLRIAADHAGPEGKIMMVVKANAYGHGVEAVCRALADEDIAFWGVANVNEAQTVRKLDTGKRIFILGPTFPDERREIVANDWTTFISSWEEASSFDSLAASMGKIYHAHIGLNTGMGREGFLPDQLCDSIHLLKGFRNLNFEGAGSHMPVADEDAEFSGRQIEQFASLCARIQETLPLRYRHLANSAGLTAWKISCCNLSRPGLMVYGHSPLGDDVPPGLKKTIRWKSRVTMLNTLPKGHGVSYGRDYITQSPVRVATVGIGYADGYPRQVSGKGASVFIRERECPVLGRVTMDQIMVDTSRLDKVEVGDEVEIFGDHIHVEDLALQAGTIVWDIFTGIGNRVKRIYN